ncbi:hypothetical protein [Aeromonas hydrophila]|uniref:hypothetical protein n=1 Tax=Aeromonas hydrophila TaxID=644 RepID=UPI001F612F73|nr:hypothetical protein [Aeromonas hydrophila]UNU29648.1 hypothetical protein GCK65_11280 [Aeromonas hydrophila]
MSSEIIVLIKIFDKEEYADAFINNGEMYCRTLGSFKEINDDVRGDRFEAASSWYQSNQIIMNLSYIDDHGENKSIELSGSSLAGPVVMQPAVYNNFYLYCMYAVKKPEYNEYYETEEEKSLVVEKINAMLKEAITLDDNVLSLGEFAVVVFNVKDFISKVKSALVNDGYRCTHNIVQYFDPETFHGDFNEIEALFRKRTDYEYQSEYRFVIQSPEHTEHQTIHLGSLEGIAIKVPTRRINDAFNLKWAEPTTNK